MRKTHLYLLAATLILIGTGAFYYKWKVLKFPVSPVEQTEVWDMQARVEYQPRPDRPNRVRLQIPLDPPGFSILDEKFVARGYGMSVERAGGGREVQWAIRRARGNQALYYRATVYQDGRAEPDRDRPQLPAPAELEEPYASAARSLLEQVREQSVDSATFAAQLLREFNSPMPSQEVALLLENHRSVYDRTRFAIELLAIRNIAARMIHGLLLEETSQGELRPYLQVYDTGANLWHTIDVRSASIGWPRNLFVWSRNQDSVLAIDGAPRSSFDIRIQRSVVDSLEAAIQRLEVRDENLVAYSLLNLPLQTQSVYRILLMVPIGAFIMLLLRNLVGVKTFGTFMPVLIAISFKWTSLFAGIVLFVLVVGMGLLVRFYMERLKLLLVPRLTAVLIVVVLIMALVSVVSNKLGLEIGLSIALFPMIIMTMTIERVSVAWDERGPGYAMKMAAGSLLIACLAYLVMSWPPLEHLIFVYPELLLVLLGFTLILGRYSGYRLTELYRFRALARPAEK